MKKSILSIAMAMAVVMSGTVMTSCKKGEDDPFLSLKSRKGRLTGEWKLTAGTSTNGGSTTTYTETQQTSNGNSSNFTRKWEIEKDGTYTKTETYTGGSTVEKGAWFWVKKNKELELKNREAFATRILSNSQFGSTSTNTGISVDGIYVLKQLKNKEMVIVSETSQNSGGSTTTWTSEFTYEKQ